MPFGNRITYRSEVANRRWPRTNQLLEEEGESVGDWVLLEVHVSWLAIEEIQLSNLIHLGFESKG